MSLTNTIMLVDDHPMLRKGVAQLINLEDELSVVAEADNGDQAISLALQHEPDIILLDLNMKGMSGIETLSALKRAKVSSKVIIFSVSDNESDVLQALKYGAAGYLLKDEEPDAIISNIYKAISGDIVMSAPLTQILARSIMPQAKQSNPLQQLTPREIDILKWLAKGKSNKIIGIELSITEATVKVHVKNLLKKLKLKTRVEAAVWAVEKRL
ncbi:MAG: two-component system response regulator NarL [Kangiellaceae bacterium]|nr:two-component system response regulator NarL [Kangiellaceae bacterium]